VSRRGDDDLTHRGTRQHMPGMWPISWRSSTRDAKDALTARSYRGRQRRAAAEQGHSLAMSRAHEGRRRSVAAIKEATELRGTQPPRPRGDAITPGRDPRRPRSTIVLSPSRAKRAGAVAGRPRHGPRLAGACTLLTGGLTKRRRFRIKATGATGSARRYRHGRAGAVADARLLMERGSAAHARCPGVVQSPRARARSA
jgi:hypothetical protein